MAIQCFKQFGSYFGRFQAQWNRQRWKIPPCCRWVHVDNSSAQKVSYVHGPSFVPLLSLTIGQSLQATVNKWPKREAVVFLQEGVRKSFSQFQQEVDCLAAGLLALGLQKGDRLGLWGPNTYAWILFQFATAKAGMIMVSLNPAYKENELEFALRKVQCNAVVCPTQFKSQRFYDILRQICPELNTSVSGNIKSASLPDLRNVVVTDSKESGMLHVDDVMHAAESQHYHQLDILQNILHPEDPINIQFTSGTTGNPKCVTLSHRNIVNNAYFIGLRMGYNWRAKVVEPSSGQLLPLGQPGELLIRGYCVMQGYWDEPERTQESISKDGWYKTGDIASLNQNGYCRIEGRIKDMIDRGGEKIFPAEVEQFLYRHPKVKDVQVVGVKDGRLGEQVCACIKVADGQVCTVEEIKAYCKDQISYFKIPHYVMFVDSYPLTVSGKVQKNKLREEMENILGL